MARNVRGTNWGKIKMENENLSLVDREKEIFSIPMDKIQNSMVNKQDIILELAADDLDADVDLISEIRFFVPTQQDQKQKEEDQENEGNEEQQQEEEEDEEQKNTFIKQLNQEIIQKAQIGANAGDSICTFPDLQLMVPRGKYSVDFYKENIRFHGSSYNYTIEYKNISRSFLLPLPDEVFVAYVIGLNKPIKQGNTIHPFIVVNFKKEAETSINLKIKAEDKEKYKWNVNEDEPMEGATNEVFASLFKQIIKVNIFIPGSFKSSDGAKAVNCSVKTNSGYFFPLQKSIIFINKPVIYIPHSEIAVVEFDRISQGNKMFDIRVVTKTLETSFIGFDKKELQNLLQYFEDRKVKIRKQDAYDEGTYPGDNQVPRDRGEGKRQIKSKAVDQLMDDDDDEEDDSDFEGGQESESEDDDFDDSESGLAQMVDENSDNSHKKKKKSKKSEKKEENDDE